MCSDAAGNLDEGIGHFRIIGQSEAQLRPIFLRLYTGADRHERGEASGMGGSDLPGAESTHREAAQVDVVAVAVELLDGGVERGQGLRLHVGLSPDFFSATLRHDYDEGEPRCLQADGVTDSDVGLKQAIGAALARSVQKQDDGPGFFRTIFGRNVDLIAVAFARDCDVAVEESGLYAGNGARCAEKQEQCECGRSACHGTLVYRNPGQRFADYIPEAEE